MSQPRRARRPEWVIGAVFLASGAALLVYIVAGMSLRWTFVALALAAVVVATAVLKRISPQRRQRIRRRMAVGAVAGFVATIGYDAARLALVEFAGLEMKPFEAWRLFGLALAETTNESTAILALGTAFHLLNGVAFGVAYTVTFGRKGILAGISWALVLETAMVSVYPGWLGLKALEEFLSVTITGHLVYGSLLGGLAKSLLGSSRWGEDDRDSSARGADRPAAQSTVVDH